MTFDNRRLSARKAKLFKCREVRLASKKIASMEVRGAGKIARSAARALKSCAQTSKAKSREDFLGELEESGKVLVSARPTAVSLPNAVQFVLNRVKGSGGPPEELRSLAVSSADAFVEKSLKAVKLIGEIGARRVRDGDVIMTHCHSNAALSIIKKAWEQGKKISVVVTESRPRYQGHITARALAKAGIPCTLIVDSAVRAFMKDVDKVIVGADSIAANGAVVNKIGTSQLALASNEARVVFIVAAESYKFSPNTLIGELVEIEERSPGEVASPRDFEGVNIRNPAFDVTPPEYIDLIITEKGVIPPQAAFMVIKEEFGWALQ